MEITEFSVSEIESIIGYTFRNKDLLEQAFTRSSYTKENSNCECNEVLEFIGDSVLGMITVKHLSQRYRWQNISDELANLCTSKAKQYFTCELDEAELSEHKILLVQRSSLALAIEQAGLEQYLRLGNSDIKGEVQNEASVKEDLLEAILGAIAIDSNWDMNALESAVNNLIDIDSRLESGDNEEPNYEKELYDKFGRENLIIEDTHSICENLKFGCSIEMGDRMLNETCFGYGNTKQGARRMAIKRALKTFRDINDRKTVIIDSVGVPTLERAVNQLQELYQKKIIPEPQYIFTQHKVSKTGNPEWGCTCVIKGFWENAAEYIDTSKNKVKKHAAFDTLKALVGTDLTEIFLKYGKIVEE